MMERRLVHWFFVHLWTILLISVCCDEITPPQGPSSEGGVRKFYHDPWANSQRVGSSEHSPPACSADDCTNGGTCHFIQGEKQCSCTPGFTGPKCEAINLDLNCDNDHMKLQVLKSVFSDMGVPASLLHLSNPTCKVEEASNLHLSVTLTHLNHTLCGTQLYVNESHVIYSNELSSHQSLEKRQQIPGELISRSSDISITFSCVYHYDHIVSLPYPLLTSSSLVTFVVKEGTINVTMTLHPTAAFLGPYDWVPAIPLSKRLYVQIQLHGQVQQSHLSLELEECWATPGMNHSNLTRHLIISKGYGNDTTVEMIPTENKSFTRFSLQMFHFMDYPEVYLHCRIWLCQKNGTECEKPNTESIRRRRDLYDPYRKVVSCGPVKLIRSTASSVGRPESGFNPLVLPGSLVAGAVLLLLCVVAVAKALKRRGILEQIGVSLTA